MGVYLQGFGISAGLIMAIGAQNVFVLSQGIRRQYQWLVPFICSTCDCVLILLGAFGIGTLIASDPLLSRLAGWGGAAFLFVYGARSLLAVFKKQALEKREPVRITLKSVVLTTFALTLLNPHVYLDTLVLIGSISGQFSGEKKVLFVIGACSASIVWFFSLSLAGSLMRPMFEKPVVWKILDGCIGVIMWGIAFSIWPDAAVS